MGEGQQVDEVYLLSRSQVLSTKNGKPYGNLRLTDRTGEVEARLWDRAEELLEPLQPGIAVRVQGRVELYQGRVQMILTSIAAEPSYDPTHFLPASPIPLEKLKERLYQAVGWVDNKYLKRLLKYLFVDESEFLKSFRKAPAAKGAHHAYVHGLLEHTVNVAGLARKIGGVYQDQLNPDILITGALIHDIGKAEELTLGPPMDYTDRGRLEGHLVLGVEIFGAQAKRIKNFPPQLAMELRHLILSHHGEYEFGSPKRPKTPEALVLHFIDDMDAKMAIYHEAAKASEASGARWSPFNRLLERFLYLGPSSLQQEEDADQSPEPAPSFPGLFDGSIKGGGFLGHAKRNHTYRGAAAFYHPGGGRGRGQVHPAAHADKAHKGAGAYGAGHP